eukprot:5730507-Alexandrium_andersonii.AAC.1
MRTPTTEGYARTLMPLALFIRWLNGVPGSTPRPVLGGDAVAVRGLVSIPGAFGTVPIRGHAAAPTQLPTPVSHPRCIFSKRHHYVFANV